jgi:hypothetical protein
VTLKALIDFCNEPGPPVASKWDRLPGLVQRLAIYAGRRAVFQFMDQREWQRVVRDERKRLAAEQAAEPHN